MSTTSSHISISFVFLLAACGSGGQNLPDPDLGPPDAASPRDRAASDRRPPDKSAPDKHVPDSAQSKIWRPAPGTTWQWQLEGKLDLSKKVKMYDIDLFTSTKATITALHKKGIKVICYFCAGSYEAWRPDAKDFPVAVLGKQLQGWNELWLDIRAPAVGKIMKKRLDLAVSKGCDGVEPDNVDAYQNKSGFPLTGADQITFNKWLAAEAHKRELSIGLKNDLGQIKTLLPHFDWALNEQCLQYKECHLLQPFIAAGKAVFHVEYLPATKAKICPAAKKHKFDTLIKKYAVDAWGQACWN